MNLNITNSQPYYWSNRIHLLLGSGAFCISEYIEGIEESYTNEKDCLFFNNQKRKKLKSIEEVGIEIIYSKIPFEEYLVNCNYYTEFILGFMSSHALYSILAYKNLPKLFIFEFHMFQIKCDIF